MYLCICECVYVCIRHSWISEWRINQVKRKSINCLPGGRVTKVRGKGREVHCLTNSSLKLDRSERALEHHIEILKCKKGGKHFVQEKR